MKYIQFIFILFVFFECKNKENIIDITVVDNSIKTKELTSIKDMLVDTVVFKDFSIIPLETNNENLVREIDRISIHNGHIYIFDNSLEKVCIFNNDGKYINQIHDVGQGPEEYIAIIDFCLDEENDEILLLCDRPYKLMRFSLDGDFINEASLSEFYGEISVGSDGLFCLLNEIKDEFEIGHFDKNFKLVYKALASRKDINKECYFIGKSLVKSRNIIYTRRFDSSVYYLSKDSIEKKYEFDFGRYRFARDLPYEEDCKELFELCKKNEYIYSITNLVESDKFILFNTNQGICLYEKETNNLTGYSILFNHYLKAGSNTYYPNEGSGNSIITYLDPSSLSYYGEETINNSPLLSDLVKKVKPDDNPILIVYEFKN